MDYSFDINATANYIDEFNEPCQCIYCRNYRQTFPIFYPKVTALLKSFGLKIDRPLNIMDLFWSDEKHKHRLYLSYYCVKGELTKDKLVIYDKDAVVTLYRYDTDAPVYNNTAITLPYFIIEVDNILLPWVLNEPAED